MPWLLDLGNCLYISDMELKGAQLVFNDKTIDMVPGKSAFADELFVEFKTEQLSPGTRILLTVHPKQKITIKSLKLTFSHAYQSSDRVFCNGYQSWTESREYQTTETMHPVKGFAAKYLKHWGDYAFVDYPQQPGKLHSWTYSYVRSGRELSFIGSLNEFTGFAVVKHSTSTNEITVEKDCSNLELDHSYPAFDLLVTRGSEQSVFDQYASLMDIKVPSAKPAVGWTSWYNYYNKVTEQDIIENLTAWTDAGQPLDVFQIDDGYQQQVGDWLDIKPSFPSGMNGIASKIKAAGYKAGVWMAPFVCDSKSKIFLNQKDWLIKDKAGNPVKLGYIPMWGGWFYGLNFYNQEVQKYLSGVIYTMVNKWNYDLLKLDFLYAAAIHPPPNKTRGQVMREAMEFLRQQMGDKQMLACGVPLGSTFGITDYCRIGPDIHLSWEHKLLEFCGLRERLSTVQSLKSTIGRRQLSGRMFLNDPDVFILRKDNNKLTSDQQYTVLLINTLLGAYNCTSDLISTYEGEQLAELDAMYKWKDSTVQSIEDDGNVYNIHFTNDNTAFVASCNLSNKKQPIRLKQNSMELAPFESIILAKQNFA